MSQKNIREKLEDLQELVADFEREDLSVEEALEQFDKGSKLSIEIEKDLAELKTKITVLKEKFDS